MIRAERAAALLAAIVLVPGLATAQPATAPEGPVDGIEHLFGATPLVAQAGNGRLSVGITGAGSLAVLRWPSATYWDHLRYRTGVTDAARSQPRMGAAANHGGFWGVWTEEQGATWLHEAAWEHTVAYAAADSVRIVTTATHAGLGVTVTLTDGVLHDDDVLLRVASVQGAPDGALLLHQLNLAPHTDLKPFLPLHEADDIRRDSAVTWDGGAGTGRWTLPDGEAGVAFRLSSAPAATGWSCGGQDGMADADDGQLSGAAEFAGAATVVLSWPADGPVALATAAGETPPPPFDATTADARLQATDTRWAERIAPLRLPATDDPELTAFAQRTLISILQGVDADTGAIVASVSQQPPYHLDWPRDGAFFNAALQVAGLTDLVDQRNSLYAALQRTEDGQDRFLTGSPAPAGSWAMNYYADGTPGGPIDFEIDEIGFAAWSMGWLGTDGVKQANQAAIKAAAAVLSTCRDEEDPRLQCPANEDDNPDFTRTLHGAETVLLGLRTAHQAGFGDHAERIAELEAGIEEVFWDEAAGHFSADGIGQNSWAIWPVQLWHRTDPRWDGVADRLMAHLTERLVEPRPEGSSYDAKATLALAHLWQDAGQSRRSELERAIRILATEVPMPGTRHLGEVYLPNPDEDGDGRPDGWSNRTSPPHLWEATLVYLSLMAFYEPGVLEGLTPEPPAPPPAAQEQGCACGTSTTGALVGGLLRR